MKNKKAISVTSDVIDRALDYIDIVLSNNGLLLPTNELEVLNSESLYCDAEDELPDILKDPMVALERGKKLLKDGFVIPSHVRISGETINALAQAARNGKEIKPELLEIMHKDRSHAEKISVDK